MSQADLGRSAMMADADDSSADDGGYAPDDFGGGDDDDGFIGGSFIHDGDHRFSSSSFQTSFEATQPPSQATVLLDAIAAGDISGSQSNYEYFNSAALENIQGNMWAGAAHWKKLSKRKTKNAKDSSKSNVATPGNKKRKGRTAASKNKTDGVLIDITKPVENLDDLLRQPPKYSKADNLLPLDLGMGVNSLTSLFLRPNSTVAETNATAGSNKPTKAVGFGGVETWADGNDSYGGDDDGGGGYDFGGDADDNDQQEFVVPELADVRRVDKIQVGYATVAKKVDVKRLKRDLWNELERTFHPREPQDDEDDDEELKEEEAEDLPMTPKNNEEDGPLSFQTTVQEMQTTQTQGDVSLPFYFICILHLANEKGLELESRGLEDFVIQSS
jgi:condensin complex subunit 2